MTHYAIELLPQRVLDFYSGPLSLQAALNFLREVQDNVRLTCQLWQWTLGQADGVQRN